MSMSIYGTRMKLWGACLVFGVLGVGCKSEPSRTTDTSSRSLPDLGAKVEFLKKYRPLPSKVDGLEFHVRYHDNSGGLVPGPSDYDIRIAARMAPGDLEAWVQGCTKAEALDWSGSLVE